MQNFKEISYLNRDIVLLINKLLMDKGAIRDENLLESAMVAPQNAAYYEGVSLIFQVAILIEHLVLNHPFVDGNKRTALIVGAIFVLINGFQIISQSEVEKVIYAKEIEVFVYKKDFQRLVKWLQDHIYPWEKGDICVERAIEISMDQFAKDLEYLKDK